MYVVLVLLDYCQSELKTDTHPPEKTAGTMFVAPLHPW